MNEGQQVCCAIPLMFMGITVRASLERPTACGIRIRLKWAGLILASHHKSQHFANLVCAFNCFFLCVRIGDLHHDCA
jgi:hypothetical protein